MNTSVKSDIAKAVRLAIDSLMDRPKIVLYALLVAANRLEAGIHVANAENPVNNTIISKPDLTTFLALSFPKTSVMTSLMVKMTGSVNIATLAFNTYPFISNGNVFAPISSDSIMQAMYVETSRSIL